MGIEIRPSGESTAYAAAGQTIGKAERAKEERARGERQAQQAQDLAARQRADQMAMDWELQKMQMRSQLDFQQELRDKQYEYDKFNRAKEWEVEKMELASRFDFEQEEKERLRRKAILDSGMETINNSDAPDEVKAKARFELKSKNIGVPGYEDILGFEEEKERQPSVEQQKWDMLSPEEQQRLARKPIEPTSEFGKPPWWTSPEWKDTPEGKAAAEHYQNETYVQQVSEAIALMQLNAMGLTPKPANTPIEETTEVPQTEDAFRTEVGRLKATDPQSAKEYYEKHKSKFGYK